jgi:hypothetical protein
VYGYWVRLGSGEWVKSEEGALSVELLKRLVGVGHCYTWQGYSSLFPLANNSYIMMAFSCDVAFIATVMTDIFQQN